MRYKLLKPEWGKPLTKEGTPNPEFVINIEGPNSFEGSFDEEFLRKKNEEGYNIYFFPNFPSSVPEGVMYARGEHIDNFDYVFVDMDLKEGTYSSKEEFLEVLKKFILPPSFVVDSGHGIHAYWKVSGLTRNDFVYTQLRLIQQFKTDDSIWTVKQIMRAPGFKNTKVYGSFVEAHYVDGFQYAEYALELMDQKLPPLTEEDEARAIRHLNKMDGLEPEEHLEDLDDTLPPKFLEALKKNDFLRQLWENPIGYQGDRSSADMKLCNELFNLDFEKNDAIKILYNTQKARSRDPGHRQSYAFSTVDKVYRDRPKYYEGSVIEFLDNPSSDTDVGKLVNGPSWLDCLVKKWRRRQVLGLVLGTGVGKTSLSIDIIYHILKNNTKGRFIVFSLEMTKQEFIEKCLERFGEDRALLSRLHVVSNETKDNDIRHIGLQEIYWITKDIRKATGDEIIGICIDHMGEVSNTVDINKLPNFNAKGDQEGGYGNIRSLGYQNLCSKVKILAKSLDVFVIMQSQTRREYDRLGDIPLGKDAAFGASNFEKMVHYMVTAWQPLMRVYSMTPLRVTAWQYAKVRLASEKDPVKIEDPRLLHYDMNTGTYRPITDEEQAVFEEWKPKADAKRKAAEKNNGEGITYRNSPTAMLKLVQSLEPKKQNA